MINNRQGGRRRGRGGGGPRSPNAGNPGNRQDTRQRGNAPQLLEKYKALARDAQMAGDRVQSEYYLQFAEHYFRVLSESRARYEDQRRSRDDYSNDDDEESDGGDTHDTEARDAEDEQPQRRRREPRPEARHEPREERAEREPRESRPRRQPRVRREEEGAGDDERISADILPPAISLVEKDEEAPKPRARRTRRPREDGDEIAPAA